VAGASRRTDLELDRILGCLLDNRTVAVSGERLARELGITHSRVVRLVNRLRGFGVEILGEAFSGFRLARLPDIILPGVLAGRLHAGEIGQNLHHLYEVDSTNRYAMDLVWRDEAPGGTLVVAESQTAGRGRRGRVWFSERAAGLYFTLVLRPDIASSIAPALTLGAALALHETVERITGLEVDVKWPNDLLVGRRKICGILSELRAEADRVSALLLGVGLNVNQRSFPPELGRIATSLAIETGARHHRTEILVDFLAKFERLYRRFVEKGPGEVIELWQRHSSFAGGRTVEIADGDRRIRGVTLGLNAWGALRVRQEDGSVEEVYSGDVLAWS
jgi:BirA family biotin operon repressor/biotin-[acetyl-CoA-carboxylase] ligase